MVISLHIDFNLSRKEKLDIWNYSMIKTSNRKTHNLIIPTSREMHRLCQKLCNCKFVSNCHDNTWMWRHCIISEAWACKKEKTFLDNAHDYLWCRFWNTKHQKICRRTIGYIRNQTSMALLFFCIVESGAFINSPYRTRPLQNLHCAWSALQLTKHAPSWRSLLMVPPAWAGTPVTFCSAAICTIALFLWL